MIQVAQREQPSLALLAELERQGAISVVGLHLAAPDLTYDRFEALCYMLGKMHEAVRFAIGDAIMLGEKQFGEKAHQALEALGLSERARLEYVRVSEKVPRSIRRPDLSWSHHRAVAALEIPQQKRWLKTASEKRLSHHELREALREGGPPAEAGVCRCCHRSFDA